MDSPKPKTVFITGGAGYIGSLLSGKLLERGHRVFVVDKLLFGGESILPFRDLERFEFRWGDIYDTEEHADWFERADAVVHLAAIVGFPACQQVGKEVAWRFNVDLTTRVFDAAERGNVERLLFASTYSNYGKSNGGALVTEDSPLDPQSTYAETKVAAENWLRSKASESRCIPILLRFATAYGISPRTRFDLSVNQFVLEALTKRRIIIYQRGYHRSFIHVRDIVRALLLLLEREDVSDLRGEAFNVGSDSGNYTKDQVLQEIRAEVPELEIDYKDMSFGGDMRDIRVSFEKIEQQLGYSTTITLPEGIREIAQAIREGWITDPKSPKYRNATFIVQ